MTSGDRALRLLEVLDRGRRMNMNRYAEARAIDRATRDATIIFCNTKVRARSHEGGRGGTRALHRAQTLQM